MHPHTWKKSSAQKCQKRRESSAQICRQKRMCTFRSDTTKLKQKKVGKKEDISKSRKRAKTKEIKKDDSRLSEIEIIK